MKLGKGRVSCWKRGLPALATKLISILQAKHAQAYFIAIVNMCFSSLPWREYGAHKQMSCKQDCCRTLSTLGRITRLLMMR